MMKSQRGRNFELFQPYIFDLFRQPNFNEFALPAGYSPIYDEKYTSCKV